MATNSAIGLKIRELRDRRHLTQQELADLLQVQRVTVTRWETGKTSISAEDLAKVSKVLGSQIDFFYDSDQTSDCPEAIIYEPIMDELRIMSYSGTASPEAIEDIAAYARMRHQQKLKRQGRD